MARNASLALSFRKIASRCSQGRNWRGLKIFGACGGRSFTVSFHNFASGCSEKQTAKSNVVAATRSARRFSLRACKNSRLRRYFGHFHRKQDAGAARQCAQPSSPACSPQKIRRLRRAFLYHFILQFRFWLQGEANDARPTRRRALARDASLALLFREIASRCSQGRNGRELFFFGACGGRSFTASFFNFASGCSEKQKANSKVVATARSARRRSLYAQRISRLRRCFGHFQRKQDARAA